MAPQQPQLALYLMGTDTLERAAADALAQANSRTARQLIALFQMFEAGIGADDRAPIWNRLRDRAQDSIARSYSQTRRRGGPAGYRQDAANPRNRRFAGGRLYRALRDPRLLVVQGDSLGLVDTNVLDEAAPQWARLQAGAAPAGTGVHETYQVTWSNMAVAALSLNMAARDPFSIPAGVGRRGYWTASGEFHPFGEGPVAAGEMSMDEVRLQLKKQTRGIQARNFIGAGYRSAARELGPSFITMYRTSWANASTRAAQMAAGGLTPRPTRPPAFRVTVIR